MSTKIKCQKCGGKSEDGCERCGGFGYVLSKTKCDNCGQEYWIRPGNVTTYDGKRFESFDGLEIICHMSGPNKCGRCEKKS